MGAPGAEGEALGPRDSGNRTVSVLVRVLTLRVDRRLEAFDQLSLREFLACRIALDYGRIPHNCPCRLATPKPLLAMQTRVTDWPCGPATDRIRARLVWGKSAKHVARQGLSLPTPDNSGVNITAGRKAAERVVPPLRCGAFARRTKLAR